MATKTTIFDLVVDKLHQRQDMIKSRLAKDYKNTKPFRTVPVPPKEQLRQYDAMTPEMEQQLRQDMGDDSFNRYMIDMEKLRVRNQNAGQ